jgi:hypothetical protein
MITHTQLTKIAFIEAVKNTETFKKIGNKVFQNMVIKSSKIDEFYENYRQGVRYGVQYLKQKPTLLSRDVQIINEIINK